MKGIKIMAINFANIKQRPALVYFPGASTYSRILLLTEGELIANSS